METAEDLGDYLLKNQNINLIDYQIKQKEALQILKGEK